MSDNNNNTYSFRGAGGGDGFDGFDKKPPKKVRDYGSIGKKIGKGITIGVIAVFVLVFVFSCWYTVDDKQQAVVTTFGRVTDVTEAGMHFMIPFGIQQVEKVDVNVFQKIELGYRTDSRYDEGYTVVTDESRMITGDYNIVNVEFFVEYKISDPVKYLYSSYEPEYILRNLVQSQVRNVVGSTNVDSVLTDGKESIQMQVKELITAVLEEYDIGLMLTDVKIQDSEPPTEEVIYAFKAVETAKQGAETAVNEAKAYENAELPKAQAEADKLLQNAEYLKQSRINEATQQVALFEAMYNEYKNDPETTRSRMYYEAIQSILPDVKLYINAGSGEDNVDMVLPLESFVDNDNTSGRGILGNEE